MRPSILAILTLTVALTGFAAGQAQESSEARVTVQVTSADHEVLEGYFSLGDDATVMVKPDTELHRFPARHRGRKVTITLSDAGGRELSRLSRDRD